MKTSVLSYYITTPNDGIFPKIPKIRNNWHQILSRNVTLSEFQTIYILSLFRPRSSKALLWCYSFRVPLKVYCPAVKLKPTAQNGHLNYDCTKILIKCNELGKTRNSYIDSLLDKFATHNV